MEHNEQLPSISTKIRDNSFYSYISNNKNVKFNLRSTNTKSKEVIEATPIYDVDMFIPQNGVYGSFFGQLFRGYRVFDAFTFIVGALSDNKVSFASDYLTQGSIWEQKELFLFDGLALRDQNTDPIMSLSFEELFSEVFKSRNVSFYIDMTDPTSPVLRLENIAFFYNQSTVYRFTDIKELLTTFKATKLYGTVNIGSEYTVGGANPPYAFPEGISYFGFKKETYTPLGQCNTDQELDLVNKFIISSNAIADQVIGVIDSNLDEVFLVECENVDTTTQEALASRYPAYDGTPNEYFYNLGLTNAKRLPVHGSNFQSAVTNTLEIGGNGFRASLGFEETLGIQASPGNPANFTGFTDDFSANDVEIVPIAYADEFGGSNYDGGNNYSNSGPNAGQYLVPVDGDYSFTARCDLETVNIKNCIVTVRILTSEPGYPPAQAVPYTNASFYWGYALRVSIEAYTDNTLATLVSSQSVFNQTIISNTYTVNCNLAATLQAGNVVVVKTQAYLYRYIAGTMLNQLGQAVPFTGIVPDSWQITGCSYSAGEPKGAIYLLETSYFECNGTPDGEIQIASNDPELFKIQQHQFTYDIPVADFQNILANPIGLFPFEKDGLTRNGWIDEMVHNNFTGRTQVKLITSDATIPQ